MIVCDRDRIKDHEADGAPDLVVEVLPPGTAKNDYGYKMKLYAESGVREYWIVDVKNKTVNIYLPNEGRFGLNDTFVVYPESELERITDEERDAIVYEFSSALFPDMKLNVEDVFDGIL
jgi:Uma2 family endonuclease